MPGEEGFGLGDFAVNDNESSFQPLSAESISSEKMNVMYLLLMQVDRVLYLITFKLANCQFEFQRKSTMYAIAAGLRSIESLMGSVLGKEYFLKAGEITEELNSFSEQIQYTPRREVRIYLIDSEPQRYLALCCQWFDLEIEQMKKLNLLPAQKQDFEFAEKGAAPEESEG